MGPEDTILFIEFFLLNSSLHSMQLGQINVLINYLIRKKQLQMNEAVAISPNAKHKLF